jgi:hypothetical protein
MALTGVRLKPDPVAESERFPRVSSEEAAIRQSYPKLNYA